MWKQPKKKKFRPEELIDFMEVKAGVVCWEGLRRWRVHLRYCGHGGRGQAREQGWAWGHRLPSRCATLGEKERKLRLWKRDG